jgi:aryl-alcohol dehydrogenase-like predicted oxidoreductase
LLSGENQSRKNLKTSKMNIITKAIGVFYNTNKESGKELKASKEKARTQNQLLLDRLPINQEFSAWSIFNQNMLGVHTPITSIRRALNTLESQGKIEKVGKRIGNLDKTEFTYKLILGS